MIKSTSRALFDVVTVRPLDRWTLHQLTEAYNARLFNFPKDVF